MLAAAPWQTHFIKQSLSNKHKSDLFAVTHCFHFGLIRRGVQCKKQVFLLTFCVLEVYSCLMLWHLTVSLFSYHENNHTLPLAFS